jgi:hypothetical protein
MLFALAGGVLGGAIFLAVRHALIDDAYITVDYARSLAFHGQWALEPGHIANTATSPLNVLLLAALTLVTRDPLLAVGVLLVASLATLGFALSTTVARLGWSRWVAGAALVLVAANPLLISTVGLETYLAVTLVAALGAAVVARRPVVAGAVIGLLVLTRADLGVFALAALATPALLRRAATVIVTAVLVAAPWFVTSWIVLGSALPDTMLLKVGERWGQWSYNNGLLLYAGKYPAAVWLAVLPAAAGLAALVYWLLPRVRRGDEGGVLAVVWGAGAVLYAVVYVFLQPAPYHWYYGPVIGSLTLLGALSLGRFPLPARRAGLVLGGVLAVVTAGFLVRHPWQTVPITTNWATPPEYAAAAALAPPGAVVRSHGEIGTLAYYCDCTVVDGFSDRGLIVERLEARRAAAGPITRFLLDLNYANLATDPPVRPDHAFVLGAAAGTGVPIETPWRQPDVLTVKLLDASGEVLPDRAPS